MCPNKPDLRKHGWHRRAEGWCVAQPAGCLPPNPFIAAKPPDGGRLAREEHFEQALWYSGGWHRAGAAGPAEQTTKAQYAAGAGETHSLQGPGCGNVEGVDRWAEAGGNGPRSVRPRRQDAGCNMGCRRAGRAC